MRKGARYKQDLLSCCHTAASQNTWRNRNVEPGQFPGFNGADIGKRDVFISYN